MTQQTTPSRLARLTLFALFIGICSSGCRSIYVRRADSHDLLGSLRSSLEAEENKGLSRRSSQSLRRYDLIALHRSSPNAAFLELQKEAIREPQADTVFALAEISFQLARAAEKWENANACRYYYLCAGYAYHYLFDDFNDRNHIDPSEQRPPVDANAPPILPPGLVKDTVDAFDPRFRLACEMYNVSLAKCIRATQKVGQLDPRQKVVLQTPDGGKFTLSVVHKGFTWKPEEFGPLLFCEDFEVVGLENHHRTYGLGVPLICTRKADAPVPPHVFYPREVSFPVTAFFRFQGKLADLGTHSCGQLELYNPSTIQSVSLAGRKVPLETDLTTPLAHFLSNTDLDGIEYRGFLRADKLRDKQGIYMFEPYQPGKIPVLMIHGLLSSPLTWAPMFNDLRADPVLRDRYQFWFYLYPTGNPWLITAADLRRTLTQLHQRLDPDNRDPALGKMVLVGHSMGGLISRLLTVESGDEFWKLVSKEPIEALKVQVKTREELQRIFYFEGESTIRRVVFLGTPHGGSNLSPSPLGRLASKLVRMPSRLHDATREVLSVEPGGGLQSCADSFPTSVDLLAPGSPALQLLAARPMPASVHYHSIIGSVKFNDSLLGALTSPIQRGAGDGVVPVESASIPGVDTEMIIPADHNHVHQHPLSVREVRRVLLENLND